MKKLIVISALALAGALASFAGSAGISQGPGGSQAVPVTVPTAGYCYLVTDTSSGYVQASCGSYYAYCLVGNLSNAKKSGPLAAGTYTMSVSVPSGGYGFASVSVTW